MGRLPELQNDPNTENTIKIIENLTTIMKKDINDSEKILLIVKVVKNNINTNKEALFNAIFSYIQGKNYNFYDILINAAKKLDEEFKNGNIPGGYETLFKFLRNLDVFGESENQTNNLEKPKGKLKKVGKKFVLPLVFVLGASIPTSAWVQANIANKQLEQKLEDQQNRKMDFSDWLKTSEGQNFIQRCSKGNSKKCQAILNLNKQ